MHESLQVNYYRLTAEINTRPGALGEGSGAHCSPLAWKTPWTEEPGGLQSVGSLRVGHG